MRKKLTLIFLLAVSVSAAASSWNFISAVNSDSSYYFFDADSIQRESGNILIWVKNVRKTSPDSDGAWATAIRYKIDCRQRNFQNMGASDYDYNNNFIKSYPKVGLVTVPPPDSIGEGIINVVCKSNFPNDKSANADYVRILDNDVFAATRRILDAVNGRIDKAPI